MSLLETLLDDSVSKPVGAPCKVTTIGNRLPEPYQAAYWRIVLTTYPDGGLPAEDASRKLAGAGIQLGGTAITKHRRGVCKCPTKG